MRAFFDSVVRTAVPYIVGFVMSWLARLNMPIDSEFETTLAALLTLIFGTLYYVAVRIFETRISPKLGWLIGLPKQPAYEGAEG